MPATNPTYVAAYYAIYLFACIFLIVVLQIVLRRAGSVVLKDAYNSNPEFARAVCRLLDIGYYLVCLGYVTMTIHTTDTFLSSGQFIETLTFKLGFFLLLLGVLHVFNLLLLALFRRPKSAQPAAS